MTDDEWVRRFSLIHRRFKIWSLLLIFCLAGFLVLGVVNPSAKAFLLASACLTAGALYAGNQIRIVVATVRALNREYRRSNN